MKYFVSYSRHDSEFVKQLALDLKIKYMDVWLDQLDIPVGAKWDTCIEHALHESMGFILVLSTSSVQSDNVMDEVNFAITKGKHIIPILLDDCEVPFRIARIQMIDSRGDYNKCIEAILETTYKQHDAPPPVNTETISDVKPKKTSSVFHPVTKVEDTPRDTSTHYVSSRVTRRKGKIKYTLVIAAIVLLFLVWLFTTSSGNELYSSVSASITDTDFTDKEKLMPLLIMVIVGAVAGWIAVKIVDSDSESFFLDIFVGIAGGFIASKWIFHGIWHLTDYYYANLIITTTVGAAILAFIIKIIRRAVGI